MNFVVMIALMLAAAGDGDPVITPPRIKNSEDGFASCYSVSARQRDLEGRVTVTVMIQPDGSLGEVEYPIGIEPWQRQTAECILQRAQFIPGTVDGRPVAAQATLPINFYLTGYSGEAEDIAWPQLRSAPEEVEAAYRACYPEDTLAMQIANYRVSIGRDGRASKIKLLESGGDTELDQVGICVIRKLRFIPARRGSQDIQSTITLPLPVRPAK